MVNVSCGVSFSIMFRVASGVTSRELNPVPPVVKITFIFKTSLKNFSAPYKDRIIVKR